MKPGMRWLIALLLGLFAGIVALSTLSRKEQEMEQREARVNVLFARAKIPAGKEIIPEMVERRAVPAIWKQPDALDAPDKAIGQVAIVTMLPNEQVQASKLASSLQPPLADVVPKGMRTVTVTTDPVRGAAGLIQVGDHLDVLGVFQIEQPSAGITPTIRVLFQNVSVVAVNTFTVPNVIGRTKKVYQAAGEEGPDVTGTTVTMAMSPFDVQKMFLAQELGKLILTMRPKDEATEPLQFQVLNPRDLLDTEHPVWTPARKEYNLLERMNRPPQR